MAGISTERIAGVGMAYHDEQNIACPALMQFHELTIGSLIDHAASHHGAREVMGRNHDGSISRTNWADLRAKALTVASGLARLGLNSGDRVATLAWNRMPHLELYFAVPSAGYVLHTVNPRLHADHLQFILTDGGARILCIEPDLLHLVEPFIQTIGAVERIVVLCSREQMPESSLPGLIAYDELSDAANPMTNWPAVRELAGSTLCYTSGTTGNPKGVLYSHRSTALHSMQTCMSDSMSLSARDNIALVTPLFHVNAWGVPFAAAICGAKLALPGSALDPQSLLSFFETEETTFALGVPTVWMGFLNYYLSLTEDARPALQLTRMFMGGAAPPPSLIASIRKTFKIDIIHAWGMTETSPVMTVSRPLALHAYASEDDTLHLQSLQGRVVFGADMRIVDEAGNRLPNDGKSTGELQVRGHWVIDRYFGKSEPATHAGNWFDTGDVAHISPDGFLQITDRAKDVIKSGGEWISSIALENAAQTHPDVAEAAVIAAAHPRWQERPLLLIRMRPAAKFDHDALMKHLAGKVASWWLPDDILVVDALPLGATGKVQKAALREQYGNHLLA
jgi:fatty-acyl-CoA synthase